MLFKLFIILQIFVLCWDKGGVSSEFSDRAFLTNAITRDESGLFDWNTGYKIVLYYSFLYTFEATGKGEVYTDNYSLINDDVDDDWNFTSNYLNDSTDAIKNLNVNKIDPDALQISWTVSGSNTTMFLIQWFMNDLPIDNATWNSTTPSVEKFEYKITNLEACTEYQIVVTSLDGSDESVNVIAKTSKTQPGAPLILTADPCDLNGTLALNISWQRPNVGGSCVEKYAISVETTIHEKRHFLQQNTSDTNILMKHLYACTSYLVTVKAVDSNDVYGLSAKIQTKATSRKVPDKPKLINNQSLPPFVSNTSSIMFNWFVFDEKNNCTIESLSTECEAVRPNGYGYDLKDGQSKITIKNNGVKTMRIVVVDLSPYTDYICYGRIYNEAGVSNKSSQVWALTREDAPSAPQNLKLVNESTFTFSWEPPAYMPGRLLKYKITFTWSPRYVVPDFCPSKPQYAKNNIDANENTFTLDGGDGFSDYIVEIAAYTKGGWSRDANASIVFQTFARGVPDKVTALEYETKPRKDDSNILQTILTWKLPCSLRGELKHFQVFVFGTKNHLANHTMKDVVEVPTDYDKNQKFGIVLGELRPQHHYEFHVSAAIRDVEEAGEIASRETDYPAGIPPMPNEADMNKIKLSPSKMPRTTTSVEVLLPLFNNTNGDIQFYAIIVSRLGFKYERAHTRFSLDDEKAWPNVSSWKEAVEVDFEIPYQATEPRWTPYPSYIVNYGSVKAVKYVLGEDVTCDALTAVSNLYCNGPLEHDTTYQVWMRAFTNGGYSDSDCIIVITDKELSVYLIIGVILGILTAGIVSAVLLTKMAQYKGVKNPFVEDDESDLERYRNRRQPINSNLGARESASVTTRTRRRIDQINE